MECNQQIPFILFVKPHFGSKLLLKTQMQGKWFINEDMVGGGGGGGTGLSISVKIS